MFKNYLKIALRNLRKYKTYSSINILGLATGMACCILILLYVRQELSYDRFHQNAEQIYRLNINFVTPNGEFRNALSSAPMAPYLQSSFPEIENAVRFCPTMSPEVLVSVGEKKFYEDRFFYADAPVFEMFTFPLINGDVKSALSNPFSVVLSEEMARKYFGDKNPLGQSIKLENNREYTITGIARSLPATSHLQFDFLASFISLETIMGDDLESWMFNPFYSYFLLPQSVAVAELETKIIEAIDSKIPESVKARGISLIPNLQPLTEIHLNPKGNDLPGGVKIGYIYLFIVVAIAILLIACVNFMNLSTARSATRAKEVGLRKVVGAERLQLIFQFLGESILMALLSFVLALMIVEMILPFFNGIIEKKLEFIYVNNILFLLSLVGITLLVGIVSGSYPALMLSAFQPVRILKGKIEAANKTPLFFRRGLVVFQFIVSIALIGGTIIIYQQIDFMKNKRLGFNKEQVLVVPIRDSKILDRYVSLKTGLLTEPAVKQVGMVQHVPGKGAWGTTVGRESASPDERVSMKYLFVDENFIDALEIELAAGRNYSREFSTDQTEAYIINETAVRELGWQQAEAALGEKIVWAGEPGTIIGVVKDFHFQPMHVFMQPLVLKFHPGGANNLLIRIEGDNIPETIAALQQKWIALIPNWPFVYSFLDQDLNNLYLAEDRLGNIIGNFTILAIFIACLGLFGLAAFSAERRTKEIGVRKVLGASIGSIFLLLSKEFVALVLIANIAAIPLAYYGMQQWLQNFSFSIEIDWFAFLFAALIAFLIAIITVSYQAVKAAVANPVESLRYE